MQFHCWPLCCLDGGFFNVPRSIFLLCTFKHGSNGTGGHLISLSPPLRLTCPDEAALRSIRSSPCFSGVSLLHHHIAAHPHLATGQPRGARAAWPPPPRSPSTCTSSLRVEVAPAAGPWVCSGCTQTLEQHMENQKRRM